MSTIVTRTVKGYPLSWAEADANFTNLNNDKLEASALASYETSAHAAATYLTITNAVSTYLTQASALATYSPITTTVSRDTATGAAFMPVGTTAQRPTGSLGYLRYNNTLNQFEGYGASGWGTIGSGATGGGTDKAFVETDVTITTDYTITTNKNAMTAGPVTINNGVTVTVPSGSTWTVV